MRKWANAPTREGMYWMTPFYNDTYHPPLIQQIATHPTQGLVAVRNTEPQIPLQQFLSEVFPKSKWMSIAKPSLPKTYKLLTLEEIKLLPQGVADNRIIRYLPSGHPQNHHKSSFWEYEHRLVMEFKLGRLLIPSEQVHHLDGNKGNNSPNNLVLTNVREHGRTHNPRRGEIRQCPICENNFYIHPNYIKLGRGIYCSRKCAAKSPDHINQVRRSLKPRRPNIQLTKYIVDQKDSGRTWESLSVELGINMWSVRSRYGWYMKYTNRKPLYIPASTHLIKRISVKCGYCGKPLTVVPSRLANNKHHLAFCNQHCSGKFNCGAGIIGKPFTNEEDELIKSLRSDGLNFNQISKLTKRNHSTIQKRLLRLNETEAKL